MFRRLLETEKIKINDQDYEVNYFENLNLQGNKSYSSEVSLNSEDKVIIDALNLENLHNKVSLLIPVALYSRSVYM
ncbi:MAG: hypothetical protein SVW57_10130 [Thermodesulfobacteriota bacterium]|nr:hypothetical protein [Thermodesulfobacteriota bacterium]